MKSGLGRITENTPQYQGVVMYSMNDLPLVRACERDVEDGKGREGGGNRAGQVNKNIGWTLIFVQAMQSSSILNKPTLSQ